MNLLDNFARPDTGPPVGNPNDSANGLGPSWSTGYYGVFTGHQISEQTCVAIAAGGSSWWSQVDFPADMEAAGQLAVPLAGQMNISVRLQNPGIAAYSDYSIELASSSSYRLRRTYVGVVTYLTAALPLSYIFGDLIGCRVVGNVVYALKNGVAISSVFDDGPQVSGPGAVAIYNASTSDPLVGFYGGAVGSIPFEVRRQHSRRVAWT